MSVLGNLLWFFCGGFFSALGWFLAGILWSITIIGLPVGKQCFKFAALAAWPFGKEIVYGGGACLLYTSYIALKTRKKFSLKKGFLKPCGSRSICMMIIP